MSSDLRIDYRPLPDATPESGLEALAAVYLFLIQRNATKAANLGGNDLQKGGEEDRMPGALGVARPRLAVHQDDAANKSREQSEDVITE